jgi:phage baseplate assembly protein V
MVARLLHRTLGPVRRRIALMISRAVLTMADDTTLLQEVQVKLLGEETLSRLERFQEYGFTSVPHAGAEALALSLGGNRSHTVIVSMDDRRYRLTGLTDGEVAIYDDRGQKFHLTRSGAVATVLGDLSATVTGNVSATVWGDASAVIGGSVAIDAGGDLVATVEGETTVDCERTIVTGDLEVGGGLLVHGSVHGFGGPLNMTGGLTNAGGNITSNGIVLETHPHGGVMSGDEESGGPLDG